MAQRNQFTRVFRCLDSRNLRDGQNITFRQRILFQRADGCGLANQFSFGHRAPPLDWFCAHVDHARRAGRVEDVKISFSSRVHCIFRRQKIHLRARVNRTLIDRDANQRICHRKAGYIARTRPRERLQFYFAAGKFQPRRPERFARTRFVVPILRQACRKKTWAQFSPASFCERSGDCEMKTDEMRKRISGQPKSHARTIYSKNERLAGTQVHLAENNFKTELLQQRTCKIFVTDTRAAGNKNQIRCCNELKSSCELSPLQNFSGKCARSKSHENF